MLAVRAAAGGDGVASVAYPVFSLQGGEPGGVMFARPTGFPCPVVAALAGSRPVGEGRLGPRSDARPFGDAHIG